MAENLLALDHYAFRGNIPQSSFMRNGYAIWKDGLGQHQGKPNPFAVKQGQSYIDRMFDLRSTHKLASYNAFIQRLQAVKLSEAMKEQILIDTLIQRKIRAGEYTKNIQAAEQANERGNYGLAYTFLLQSEKDFEQLREDYQKQRFSLSHANEFWKAEYQTFLKQRLQQWLDTIDQGVTDEQLELTPEQIVDEWISSLCDGSNGITALSLKHLREDVIKKTKDFFKTKGVLVNDINLSSGAFKDALARDYGKTQKGRNRKLSTQITKLARELGQATARGMGQELMQTLQQGKYGLSFNTGSMMKRIKKEVSGVESEGQIKNDVISYVMTEIELFPQQIIDDLNAAAESELSVVLEDLEKRLNDMEQHSSNRIFRVVTSVKGYQSKHDLAIAKEGNFLQRVKNLRDLSSKMPENSMQKLIFMLANTMEGCIAEDRITELSDYIAAVAVAWMWDDYTGLFATTAAQGKIEEIKMFASGGIYYSASQILGKTLDNLISRAGESDRQFVSVNIETPKFNAHSLYDQLCKSNPIQPKSDFSVQQNILAVRWQAMRDKIMAEGKMGISFNQELLEEINGALDIYLGNKN